MESSASGGGVKIEIIVGGGGLSRESNTKGKGVPKSSLQ